MVSVCDTLQRKHQNNLFKLLLDLHPELTGIFTSKKSIACLADGHDELILQKLMTLSIVKGENEFNV